MKWCARPLTSTRNRGIAIPPGQRADKASPSLFACGRVCATASVARCRCRSHAQQLSSRRACAPGAQAGGTPRRRRGWRRRGCLERRCRSARRACPAWPAARLVDQRAIEPPVLRRSAAVVSPSRCVARGGCIVHTMAAPARPGSHCSLASCSSRVVGSAIAFRRHLRVPAQIAIGAGFAFHRERAEIRTRRCASTPAHRPRAQGEVESVAHVVGLLGEWSLVGGRNGDGGRCFDVIHHFALLRFGGTSGQTLASVSMADVRSSAATFASSERLQCGVDFSAFLALPKACASANESGLSDRSISE